MIIFPTGFGSVPLPFFLRFLLPVLSIGRLFERCYQGGGLAAWRAPWDYADQLSAEDERENIFSLLIL